VTPRIASHLQYLRDCLCQDVPVLRDDGTAITVLLIELDGGAKYRAKVTKTTPGLHQTRVQPAMGNDARRRRDYERLRLRLALIGSFIAPSGWNLCQ
jgi:hypothetical protein